MRHFEKLSKNFLDDLSSYINTYLSPQDDEQKTVVGSVAAAPDDYVKEPHTFYFVPQKKVPKASAVYEEAPAIELPEKQPTFQQNLFKLIDASGMKDSAVYKRADIDRRLFSKIRADVDYHPSKSTAIKLCLALSLDIVQTERLLETAGYCLSLSDTADLVVRYFIDHNNFRLVEVNEALDYFGQEIL